MTRATFVLALLGGWFALFGVAHAQSKSGAAPIIDPIDIPPEHDPLAHAWRRPGERGGFYTRALLSLTGLHSTRLGAAPWESEGGGLRARGFGSGFGLDVGGVLAPWVALHLAAHMGVLWNGNLDQDFGIEGSVPDNVRVVAYGLAPAATFFAPHGFFFTGAFGVGLARTKYTGYNNLTDPGFFMNMVAGKDLYVGRNVAFGIQMQIVYMLLGDEQKIDEARVRQFLFGMSLAFDSI
jgi:hypothetical protein